MLPKIISPILNSAFLARRIFALLLQGRKRRYLSLSVCTLILVTGAGEPFNNLSVSQGLIDSGAIASASQARGKRIVTLRHNNTTDGSRCTITSDSTLEDYSSYVEGERFFVRVPRSTLVRAGTHPTGSGFADMRVEQSGDDVVISFLLQLGATVQVNQSFNRLEINFLTNERANKNEKSE